MHALRHPNRLYKYREFGINSLRMITEAELFVPQPKTFNDPFDCSAALDPNIDRLDLEKVLYRLLLKSGTEEAAREAIGYNRYMSTEYGDYKTDKQEEAVLKRNVAYQIEREFNRQFGAWGVLAFSQTWKSTLMWSHYGDNHRGLCIEYDTEGMEHPELRPVRYGKVRAIKASDLYSWLLRSDDAARARAMETFFYSKAGQWRYEKEWREVSEKHGLREVEYRVSAIYFGMRSDRAVVSSVVKLLEGRDDIDLYLAYAKPNSFQLSREHVDRDEISALAIREPSFLMFRDFDDLTDQEKQMIDEIGSDGGFDTPT